MFKKAFDYVKNTTAGKLIAAGVVLTVGGVVAFCTLREKDEKSGEEKKPEEAKEETKPEEKKDESGK